MLEACSSLAAPPELLCDDLGKPAVVEPPQEHINPQ